MPHDEQKLTEAKEVIAGMMPRTPSWWRHKGTGKPYALMGGAINEADLVPVVVYRPLMMQAPHTEVWVRPLAEFLERFEPLTDREKEALVRGLQPRRTPG